MAFLASLSLGSILSGAASAAATGVSVLSQVAASRYQAKVAEYNANIADQNAKRAEQRAAIEAQDNDMATLGMLGEQEAAQTASGVSLRSKSAVLTRRAARQLGRRDTLNIVQAGDVEAYNYRVTAAGERANAQMANRAATGSLLGGFLSIGGSLIGNSQSSKKKFNDPMARYYGSPYDPYARKYA